MSVSLTMIPVALALRVVMGKERFDSWIQSMEVTKKTNFKSERELITTVKKCGYDAEKWADMVKTHIRGEKEFFFWELRGGAWHAVFSKYDNMGSVKSFMKTLEQRAGRVVFSERESENLIQQPLTQIFPTNFRDRELLKQVLQENDIHPIEMENGQLTCDLGNARLQFYQSSPDSLITVELSGASNTQSIFRHLSLLDEDYKSYIQERAYHDVKEKAEEKGLTIEHEQILEDNSIVITLNIQR